MDCQSWVLAGGLARFCVKVPAANEHMGDLGEGGIDPHWAFQPPATPTNHTPESYHEGPGFLFFFFFFLENNLIFFFLIFIIYLFIYGCVGSSFLCEGFL